MQERVEVTESRSEQVERMRGDSWGSGKEEEGGGKRERDRTKDRKKGKVKVTRRKRDDVESKDGKRGEREWGRVNDRRREGKGEM